MEEDRSSSLPQYEQLSDVQEQVLAILPIPSAVMSVLGSFLIIFMALKSRERKDWTPYTRLLIAMSTCDIVFSITIGSAAFLRPRATSTRVWAFGNDASCSFVGFMNQLSFSAVFYNGMLSMYFLLTARFGLKNEYVSKVIEPMMHAISIGFPLLSAMTGAMLGIYGESAAALGCWVANYGCDENGENCLSQPIGWLYYAIPALFVFLTLIVNNLVIFIFVKQQALKQSKIRRLPKFSSQFDDDSSDGSNDDSSSSNSCCDNADLDDDNSATRELELSRSFTKETATSSPSAIDSTTMHQASKVQSRRLNLVSTQAFLFVASYFTCNIWSGIMGLADSATHTEAEELAMMVRFYPIAVLQAALLPLQGLFNMLVYIRPKYLKRRYDFPKETRTWAIKRAIFGDEPKPPADHGNKPSDPQAAAAAETTDAPSLLKNNSTAVVVGGDAYKRLPKAMVSSLTASRGDFDHVMAEDTEDTRWDDNEIPPSAAPSEVQRTPSSEFRSSLRAVSGLEAISEISVSLFEPIVEQEVLDSCTDDDSLIGNEKFDNRWSSESRLMEPGGDGRQTRRASLESLCMPPRRITRSPELLEETASSTNTTSDDDDDDDADGYSYDYLSPGPPLLRKKSLDGALIMSNVEAASDTLLSPPTRTADDDFLIAAASSIGNDAAASDSLLRPPTRTLDSTFEPSLEKQSRRKSLQDHTLMPITSDSAMRPPTRKMSPSRRSSYPSLSSSGPAVFKKEIASSFNNHDADKPILVPSRKQSKVLQVARRQ